MPKITVIVPVYKVESYLHRCVDSILNQTFTDFELILVDDGSPDNCGAICDEYINQRITVIHQPNGGLSAARNAGIDWAFVCSDSQWITFIDSDDWVDMEYLSVLISAVSSSGASVSSCKYVEVFDSNYHIFDSKSTTKKLYFENFYCANIQGMHPITAWAKLYKKELFSKIRFPIGKVNEDLYTTHRVLFLSNYITVVDYYGYYYNKSGDSITRSLWTKSRFDEIFGSEQLIQFMYEKGFTDGERWATQWYLWVLYRQVNEITEVKEYYKHEYKELKRKLGLVLKRNKILFPFRAYRNCYELAFPRRTRMRNRVENFRNMARSKSFSDIVRYYLMRK